MNHVTPSNTRAPQGVRGWLLALCVVMTGVGPLISAWLIGVEYDAVAPDFEGSRVGLGVFLLTASLTAASAAYGVRAGLRLWAVRPGAVALAKKALLFGLAVDVVTTALHTAIGPVAESSWAVRGDLASALLPSLIFFTVIFAYLNRSARVQATYAE